MLRTLSVAALALLVLPGSARADRGWVWPVEGRVITSFDFRPSQPYAPGQHRGIDIRARPGTRVVAVTPGTVAFTGALGQSGLTVSIDTHRGGLRTSYLHLSDIWVADGQEVGRGQAIGTSGTSGSPSGSAPHLHLGVRAERRAGSYLDPLAFLPHAGDVGRPPPVGPGGLRGPRTRPFAAPRRAPARVRTQSDPGFVIAGIALAALAACLGAPAPRRTVSSIARRWAITSQRRSTT